MIHRILIAALVLFATPLSAWAVVLEAVTDVWIRESAPDTTYENDMISVWNSFSGDPGTRRYGVVQFDISSLAGIDITEAYLGLWGSAHPWGDELKAIKQSSLLIDTTAGTPATSMTWNAYQNEYSTGAVQFESLGTYDLAAPTPTDVFFYSSSSAADIALIETAASAGNQFLTLVMIADELDGVDYAHSWGDGPDGWGGENAQLVINEALPDQSPQFHICLGVDETTGEVAILNTATSTSWNLDGYVIQSASGALLPDPTSTPGVGWDSLADAGLAGWEEVAPTANALSELNLTASMTLDPGARLGLGFAVTAGTSLDDISFDFNLVDEGTVTPGWVVPLPSTHAPDADFDGDGDVDGADFLIWQRGFGLTNQIDNSNGDADGSGIVDGVDLNEWKNQFGTGGAGGALVCQVPEPGSLMLLAGLAMGLGLYRWRMAY
ncbi:MAG: PEP-CTERM sorting domain-containing protein [Pirellulales bacterium]|nr:PEP-CTERM sorting domain-containing protein [Pirellulales bacterium]